MAAIGSNFGANQHSSVMTRLEARVESLEAEKRQASAGAERSVPGNEEFGTALQRVFDSLGRPHQLWEIGNLEQRKIIQSLMFTGPVEYSDSEGFGTTKFSLPFKLLQLDRQGKPDLVELIVKNWNQLLSKFIFLHYHLENNS